MTDPLSGKQWRIVQDDVRQVLAGMDDQSAHCVVTSPPYWGLRDYGLPPLLWGGSDECEHQWGDSIIKKGITGGKDNPFAEKLKIKGNDNYQETPDSMSQFCRLCGCWRGSLGLEPTPDCGRPFQELRPDLTEKERAYVISELETLGLLE